MWRHMLHYLCQFSYTENLITTYRNWDQTTHQIWDSGSYTRIITFNVYPSRFDSINHFQWDFSIYTHIVKLSKNDVYSASCLYISRPHFNASFSIRHISWIDLSRMLDVFDDFMVLRMVILPMSFSYIWSMLVRFLKEQNLNLATQN